jgi:hypothetical protein
MTSKTVVSISEEPTSLFHETLFILARGRVVRDGIDGNLRGILVSAFWFLAFDGIICGESGKL